MLLFGLPPKSFILKDFIERAFIIPISIPRVIKAPAGRLGQILGFVNLSLEDPMGVSVRRKKILTRPNL